MYVNTIAQPVWVSNARAMHASYSMFLNQRVPRTLYSNTNRRSSKYVLSTNSTSNCSSKTWGTKLLSYVQIHATAVTQEFNCVQISCWKDCNGREWPSIILQMLAHRFSRIIFCLPKTGVSVACRSNAFRSLNMDDPLLNLNRFSALGLGLTLNSNTATVTSVTLVTVAWWAYTDNGRT